MKTKLLSLLFLFSSIIIKTYATHVSGGELYYCSLGGGSYLVTYVYYNNCGSLTNPNPTTPPSGVTLKANSVLLSFNLLFTIPMLPGPNGTEITQICDYAYIPPTTCNSSVPLYQGFTKWVYRNTITLPAPSTDWILSTDIQNRAQNISTIDNPGNASLYVEATLDNVNAPNNCSPVFSNPSMFYACIGQLNSWNYSATDADGDSLVYSLTTARQSITNVATPLTYLSPFSPTNPLTTSAPGFTLNANTGMISFTPTANGDVAVVCIRTDEYRNGVLIGSVIRDHMLVATIFNYNFITGSLFIDSNSNNVKDAGEPAVPNRMVAEINTGRFGFSQSTGIYSVIVTDTGNFTVSPSAISYYNAVPASHSTYFPAILLADSLNDFAFQPTAIFNDLCVTISPLSAFRAGFNASYMINYINAGTTIVNNCSIIFFPDTSITYVTSSATPFLITSDSVMWNIGTLAPFQTGSILVTVHVNAGTPANTLIDSGVRIEPVAGDAEPGCNSSYSRIYTTGSFDPNEIIVDEDTLLSTQISNPPYLEYIIRFQNIGNDTAFNVKVLNPIDTNKLQISTLEFVASSHTVNLQWMVTDRKMEFKFDNILLPESNVNEPASHGFVRYKIKPKSTLNAGDNIVNSAAIYFDFNAPVITNNEVTRIVLFTSTLNLQQSLFNILLYPNPATNEIKIAASKIESIEIYNTLGEKVYDNAETFQTNTETINVSKLSSGIYFVRVRTSDGMMAGKFVKE